MPEESPLRPTSSSSHGDKTANTTENPSEPWPKRPKIVVACEECRQRKVKCDGAKPRCGACRRRRRAVPNCVYKPDRGRQVYSTEYVESLESRLRALDSTGGDVKLATTDGSARPSPSRVAVGKSRAQQTLSPLEDPQTLVSPPSTLHSETQRTTHDRPSVPHSQSTVRVGGVDAMGNLGSTEASYVEGSSSVASFTKQLKDAVASRLSLPGLGANISSVEHNEWPFTSRSQSAAELYVLPSKRTADQMMEVYWNEVHCLYPFFDRCTFERRYEGLWASGADDRSYNMLFCHLNCIFALICQLQRRHNPDKGATGDIYFRRAGQLLQMSVFGGGSFELVQACLLMTQYLQSTEWAYRCWMTIGTAIRVAQSIGLHQPECLVRSDTSRDRELARRLWHGCVLLDRVVSMTLGRPMTISKTDVLGMPLPTTNEPGVFTSSPEGLAYLEGSVPRLEFFVQTLKLYQITEEMLSTIYSREKTNIFASSSVIPPHKRLENLDLNIILKIDTSLRQWKESLPAPLQPQPIANAANCDNLTIRLANMLQLRFLQIRILLFRPVLALLLTTEALGADPDSVNAPSSLLARDMAVPCAQRCVANAMAVIEMSWDWRMENCSYFSIEPLPAWWYQTFYLYTAAVVLIPARRFEALRGNIPASAVMQSWDRALKLMESLSPISLAAKRCYTSLQLLNQEIVGDFAQQQQQLLQQQKQQQQQQPGIDTDAMQGITPHAVFRPNNGNTWHDTDVAYPLTGVDGVFDQMPLDFSWIDSLPVDLSVDEDIMSRYIGSA